MSTATMPARSGVSRAVHRPWPARVIAQPLAFLESLRNDGRAVVPFKLGGRTAHLVTEPELVAPLLQDAALPAATGPWYLERLFLPRRPRLAEPASVDQARRRADAWVEGQPLEMVGELRALCRSIAWEALTGTHLGPDRPDAALARLVAERRGRDTGDLLSVLVAEGGSDEQIAARARAWLAGDRTHAALVWTMWLLAQHGEAEARWHAALGRPDAVAATERLVSEAVRLYPPVWATFLVAPDDALVPRGDLIALSPWIVQRDERWWPDPLRFDPARFEAAPAEGTFFPFGDDTGAVRHAARVMAELGARWAYRQSEPRLSPAAGWALAPRGGARMKPVPRP